MNKNLEAIVKERTTELELQNKKIKELTYANSHRVRACVARITGLIHLTDTDASPVDRDLYYKKIKETADEIEKETAKISVILSEEGHI